MADATTHEQWVLVPVILLIVVLGVSRSRYSIASRLGAALIHHVAPAG